MGKRWDVTRGDSFMVLDQNGRLIRGVAWADEDRQVYGQLYVHEINAPLTAKKTVRCAVREGHGPFTVVAHKGPFNRRELLKIWVKQKGWLSGAEIGVAKGDTTAGLLEACPSLHMTMVDFWPAQFKRFEAKCRHTMKRFPPERLTFINKPSVEAAKDVPDESLDFVFIDADHTEESCSADIIAWLPKVRSTGMIMGHDANWDGVEKAFTKLLKKVSVWRPDEVWYANKSDQEEPDPEDRV